MKILNRWMACIGLLLIPCLLMDSVMACAVNQAKQDIFARLVFSEEAFALRATQEPTGGSARITTMSALCRTYFPGDEACKLPNLSAIAWLEEIIRLDNALGVIARASWKNLITAYRFAQATGVERKTAEEILHRMLSFGWLRKSLHHPDHYHSTERGKERMASFIDKKPIERSLTPAETSSLEISGPLRSHIDRMKSLGSRETLTLLAKDAILPTLLYEFEPLKYEWTIRVFDPKDKNHVRWFHFEGPNGHNITGYRITSAERNSGTQSLLSEVKSNELRRFLVLTAQFVAKIKSENTWLLKTAIPPIPAPTILSESKTLSSTERSEGGARRSLLLPAWTSRERGIVAEVIKMASESAAPPRRLRWDELVQEVKNEILKSNDESAASERLWVVQQLANKNNALAIFEARKRATNNNALDRTLLAVVLYQTGHREESHGVLLKTTQEFKLFALAKTVLHWMNSEKRYPLPPGDKTPQAPLGKEGSDLPLPPARNDAPLKAASSSSLAVALSQALHRKLGLVLGTDLASQLIELTDITETTMRPILVIAGVESFAAEVLDILNQIKVSPTAFSPRILSPREGIQSLHTKILQLTATADKRKIETIVLAVDGTKHGVGKSTFVSTAATSLKVSGWRVVEDIHYSENTISITQVWNWIGELEHSIEKNSHELDVITVYLSETNTLEELPNSVVKNADFIIDWRPEVRPQEDATHHELVDLWRLGRVTEDNGKLSDVQSQQKVQPVLSGQDLPPTNIPDFPALHAILEVLENCYTPMSALLSELAVDLKTGNKEKIEHTLARFRNEIPKGFATSSSAEVRAIADLGHGSMNVFTSVWTATDLWKRWINDLSKWGNIMTEVSGFRAQINEIISVYSRLAASHPDRPNVHKSPLNPLSSEAA